MTELYVKIYRDNLVKNRFGDLFNVKHLLIKRILTFLEKKKIIVKYFFLTTLNYVNIYLIIVEIRSVMLDYV